MAKYLTNEEAAVGDVVIGRVACPVRENVRGVVTAVKDPWITVAFASVSGTPTTVGALTVPVMTADAPAAWFRKVVD